MRKIRGRTVKICSILLTQVILCGLVGCGKTNTKSDDQLTVGIVYYEKKDAFINSYVESLKEMLKKYQIKVIVRNSESSQKLQNSQVQELADSGCDILCVNLVERGEPSNIIDTAKENDIPVIFFNREPVEEDMEQWDKLYYVGADAEQSGQLQGEIAADYIERHNIDRNNDGIIQYVVIEGEMGHQDSIIRTEVSVETLKKHGISLEKLSYKIANWNRAQAQNRMEQMIGEYKNQIELVLANNDEMALGAIDAYKKFNYTEDSFPVFFGIDGTQSGVEAVENGELAGTVYNDKYEQARAITKLIIKLSEGEHQELSFLEDGKYIYIPYQKVTKEKLSILNSNY